MICRPIPPESPPRRRLGPVFTVTRTLATLLPCALLATACAANDADGGGILTEGRVAVEVAPLEGVDVARCTYHVAFLTEMAPGSGTFTPYFEGYRESDGPAGSWSAVQGCLAGATVNGVRGSSLNMARVSVEKCTDATGNAVTANLPLTQSRLFECVDERDTRVEFTFFLELELGAGFSDIVASIFGFQFSLKSDCQDAFVPFEDERGILRHMPALIAALAWQAPANYALPIELYTFHHYVTDAHLPAGVDVSTYEGTLADGTEYSNVAAPAPVGNNSTLDRYAVFGPLGADLARVDHGLPVLTWHVAASKDGGACEVSAQSGVSTCQIAVNDDQGVSSVLALLPTTDGVDGAQIKGLQLIGGTHADGNGAPTKKYFAKNADGKPISISALSCCVDSCCTGEDN